MNPNIYKILDYFNTRLQGILKFEEWVEQVRLYVTTTESYGRDYFRIHFSVDLADRFLEKMSADQRKEVYYHFSDVAWASGHQFVSFLVYNDKDERGPAEAYSDRLRSYKEFADCYNHLAAFLVMFLEARPGKNIKIKVGSLDAIPEFNYIDRFWKSIDFTRQWYEYIHGTDFRDDHSFHERLLELSYKSKEHYKQNKQNFIVTDEDLSDRYHTEKGALRWLLFHHQVPIHIEGFKTIDTIYIDSIALQSLLLKLEEENSSDLTNSFSELDADHMRQVIKKAIARNAQQQAQTKKLRKVLNENKIAEGDVVLFTDNIIAQVTHIEVQPNVVLYNCTSINNNLQLSKRSSTWQGTAEVTKFLPQKQYLDAKAKYNWNHRWQLHNWIMRKGKVVKQ